MNALDVALIVGALIAFVGGWRLGFVQRLLSWCGLFVGLVGGSAILAQFEATTTSTSTLVRALAVLAFCATVGNVLGHVIGGYLRSTYEDSAASIIDSVGGAVIGVWTVFLMAWMVLPSMTQVPGWSAEAARSSVIAGRLSANLGQPPNVLSGLSRALGLDSTFDLVPKFDLGGLNPTAPPTSPLPEAVTANATRATVRIQAQACGMVSSGSGVVVYPGIIVTNAHVVAGGEGFRLTNDSGLEADAELRAVDIVNDVAVLVSPGLDIAPLPLVATPEGGTGAIFGYPGGGPMTISPYLITTIRDVSSVDIYGENRASRTIAIVGSRISPGVSGGPLVNAAGQVEGLAFGVAPDNEQMAYAVPTDAVVALLDRVSPTPVASGACTR